jgi:hypothetical protein
VSGGINFSHALSHISKPYPEHKRTDLKDVRAGQSKCSNKLSAAFIPLE